MSLLSFEFPLFCILHVDDPAASAAFYAEILQQAPVQRSPTFAMFALNPALMLGLWSKHTVEPPPVTAAGCVELAFPVAGTVQVDALYRDWYERGLPMAQAPVRLDFGYAFTALDPDGHRLRVFAPAP